MVSPPAKHIRWRKIDRKAGWVIYKNLSCGDHIELKKQHPCGSRLFEVIRTGADFKIKCLGCAHILLIPREKLMKSIKK